MSSSTIQNSEQIQKKHFSSSILCLPCSKCGGNGYLKISVNRYQTCLNCFGKGSIIEPLSK